MAKIASSSDTGGSTPGGGGGGSASAPPQFNIVGQSSTNQLSATIAGQQNRPIQTYVVGNQITNQQALDRNALQCFIRKYQFVYSHNSIIQEKFIDMFFLSKR